jgi:UDP-N-acetylmuramate dehydrogenase
MIQLNNERLKKYTCIKIGGVATNFFIPENKDELIELTNSLKDSGFKILSGGSNLLISDKKPIENVIFMKDACSEISVSPDGTVVCGSSVRIQKLINEAKKKGFGGIEYLYSLPAMFGGIICMNAGRGKHIGQAISDHVVEVYAVKDGVEYTFSKEECGFEYRNSIFKNSNYVILGAKLLLNPMSESEIDKKINERLELCKRIQDSSGFNFGSVFSNCNSRIMGLLQRFSLKTSGVKWSNTRGNWLINNGKGTFKQAKRKIENCKKIHRLLGKSAEVEVIIWE